MQESYLGLAFSHCLHTISRYLATRTNHSYYAHAAFITQYFIVPLLYQGTCQGCTAFLSPTGLKKQRKKPKKPQTQIVVADHNQQLHTTGLWLPKAHTLHNEWYLKSTLQEESSCSFGIDFLNIYFLSSLRLLQNQFSQQKTRRSPTSQNSSEHKDGGITSVLILAKILCAPLHRDYPLW